MPVCEETYVLTSYCILKNYNSHYSLLGIVHAPQSISC